MREWKSEQESQNIFCRVEDENVQQNLNIIRKIALSSVKLFKDKNNSKRPFSKIMFDCLLDPSFLLPLLDIPQN